MQTISFYVNAESTLGEVRDYANAQGAAAPTLTRGVSACLKMRLFASKESNDPYPLTDLAAIPAWQWVMDDDFDSTSNYILVADHDEISVSIPSGHYYIKKREAGYDWRWADANLFNDQGPLVLNHIATLAEI